MSRVIDFTTYRTSRQIAQYDDCRVRFAREVEQRFHAMEEAERLRNAVSLLAGCYSDTIPSDVEVK